MIKKVLLVISLLITSVAISAQTVLFDAAGMGKQFVKVGGSTDYVLDLNGNVVENGKIVITDGAGAVNIKLNPAINPTLVEPISIMMLVSDVNPSNGGQFFSFRNEANAGLGGIKLQNESSNGTLHASWQEGEWASGAVTDGTFPVNGEKSVITYSYLRADHSFEGRSGNNTSVFVNNALVFRSAGLRWTNIMGNIAIGGLSKDNSTFLNLGMKIHRIIIYAYDVSETEIDSLLININQEVDASFLILESAVNVANKEITELGLMKDDSGELQALQTSVDEAGDILEDQQSTAEMRIEKAEALTLLTCTYSALQLYTYTDSIEAIGSDSKIGFSYAPNWEPGTYPSKALTSLNNASDLALEAYDNYTSIKDIHQAVGMVKNSIETFWSSIIGSIRTLPFRLNSTVHGLPGERINSCWTWLSPIFYLSGNTNTIRMTVMQTNNGATYNNRPFPTLAEFMLLDESGNKIELTGDKFTTNSIVAGVTTMDDICDGDITTHYHAAYSGDVGIEPGEEYVWIEVTLPKNVSAFQYKQIGRSNGNNTPIDIIFSESATDVSLISPPDLKNPEIVSKVTELSQITDDGFYALFGLKNSDPVNGTAAKGKYFKGITSSEFISECAFVFENAGEGNFFIRSIYNNKFISAKSANSAATETLYSKTASKFSIVPSGNANLANSFRIFENNADYIDGEGVSLPKFVLKDGGTSMYVAAADANLSNIETNGMSEWYIYHMTMDSPYEYWLQNVLATVSTMGLVESSNPGFYSDLGTFPTILANAQQAVENGDFANAKAMVAELNSAVISIQDVVVNPIIEDATYIFRTGYDMYYTMQSVNKAMYVNEVDGEPQRPGWGDEVESDSSFWFVIEKSTETDVLKELVDSAVITLEESESAYSIKNVKYGKYIGSQTALSVEVPLSDVPVTYILRNVGAGKFNLWNPGNGSWCLHTNQHASGAGKNGNLVYWTGTTEPSRWYMRVANTTSIDDLGTDDGSEIVRVVYYNLSGVANDNPKSGINIVKTIYSNGVVRSKKFIKK